MNQEGIMQMETTMLRSNLCDYADSYILVKGTITITGNADTQQEELKQNY